MGVIKPDSSNVGIAAIFLGATVIVVVLTRLLKRVKELCGMPIESAIKIFFRSPAGASDNSPAGNCRVSIELEKVEN
jgi:hypothetical protein